jgi:hypothetical protein
VTRVARVLGGIGRWGRRRLSVRGVVLTMGVATWWLLVGLVAWLVSGGAGLGASLAAAVTCWLPALVSLALAEWLRGPNLLAGWLGGMAVRLGVPLGCAVAVQARGGWLAEAGYLYYLAALYPLTLLVETWLSLPTEAGIQAGS